MGAGAGPRLLEQKLAHPRHAVHICQMIQRRNIRVERILPP